MKFNQITYKRIDTKEILSKYDNIIKNFSNAKTAQEQIDIFLEHEKIHSYINTMFTIARVRNTINTKDEFYDNERKFSQDFVPFLEEKVQELYNLVLKSDYKKDITDAFGEVFIKGLEIADKTFSKEIITDLQKEQELTTEYQMLIASAEIEFDGKKLNISQLAAYKEDVNRDVRKSAFIAEGNFYMSHSQKLDTIYSELVKVRTEIAKKLGYENFIQLGYDRLGRNCYNSKDVFDFRKEVVSSIVPIVGELKKAQQKRIGIDDFKFYDDNITFLEGNAKPFGTPDEMMMAAKKMYTEMSDETTEFINVMIDNELFDVVAKSGKAVGGYCTHIDEYKVPFIFSNFNGTSGDVDVLTHEAGHAFAYYLSRNNKVLETTSPTMESCEVHSMTMEFLAWPWLNLFYGDDTDRAKYAQLESSLVFIPYGCLVDHFQHEMYKNPDMTPEQRNQTWLKLENEYRPYIDFADLPFYSDGRGWQRQLHIYQYPFYYIDYCLAQTVALMFWGISQKDYKASWEQYMTFTKLGGRATFVDLCNKAEISVPFDNGSLDNVANAVKEFLK